MEFSPAVRRPVSPKRGWVVAVIIIGLIFLIASAGLLWLNAGEYSSKAGVNILVLGTDINVNEPGKPSEEKVRADTILVVGIRDSGRSVRVLSIPRDTLVDIPGHGIERVNAAHAYGGIPLTVKTLERFLGVPIRHYVKTNYRGFVELIDVVGGVDVNIEKDLQYRDKSQGLVIDLKKGRRRLDGGKALQYARFRHDPMGDIGRVGRQQTVIKALAREILSIRNVRRWPEIWRVAWKNVTTDIRRVELFRLAWAVRGVRPDGLETKTLPGHFLGVYWEAEPEALKETVTECLAGPPAPISPAK